MVTLRRLISGVRRLTQKTRFEQELDGELRAYMEAAVEHKMSAGMSRAEAVRAARVEIGSLEAAKDGARDVGWESLVEAFWQDTRYAARLLWRNPLFALTAALSLAVGMGATTTIFTVANGLLLRAAPGVSDPERLVDISRTERGQPISNPLIAYRTYLDLRERVSTLDALYAQQGEPEPMVMGRGADSERILATVVTANYFGVLGVSPASGRLFGRDSEEQGASRIVVLSHGFWKRRFNADSSIVGRTLQLNGEAFTVVGVAAEEFRGTSVVALDVWIPIGAKTFDNGFFTSRMDEWGLVGGRMKPGVSITQVASELDAIRRALEADYPNESRGRGFLVAAASPIPPSMRLVIGGFLALLMALVSLVLIITCANVAGILLARAAARRREISVRIAIGAGRARVVRQLLTETLLLFVVGGGTGLLFAQGMTSLLFKLLPAFEVPVAVSLPLDGRVIAFAVGVSLVAAVLSGLAPALQVAKADVVTGLKDESQGPSDRLRLRNAFIVSQIAFGILLVTTAGVLGRAMGHVVAIDQGFDSTGVEAASFDLSQAGYTDATGLIFARDLADRLRAMRGVEAVTVADQVPPRGMAAGPLIVPGVPPPDGRQSFIAAWNIVDTGYFDTLRLPLVAGRAFNAGDRAGTQPVAIIAEAGARQLWPGQDPVGKRIQRQATDPGAPGRITTLEVIGVTRDLRFVTRGGGAPPIVVYVPLLQRYTPHLTILARMAQGEHATAAITAVLRSMNANVPPATARPLDDQNGPVQVQLRVAAAVAGSVGLVALLLAAMGIYGITAYTVARRTREIGIRIAMGAERGDIVRLVLGQGMSLVLVGCVIGLALAAGASRLLTRLLFGASPLDPLAFSGAVVLFAIVGLAACYMPVRRATHIDAMDALRYE